jgi:hypothetical protein
VVVVSVVVAGSVVVVCSVVVVLVCANASGATNAQMKATIAFLAMMSSFSLMVSV